MYLSRPQRLAAVLCLCGSLVAESSGIWLDVPFVQQEKNGCGAAVISMVLQYWQKQQPQRQTSVADASEIQRSVFTRSANGTYASDMQKYFEEHGFRAFAFKGDWEMLRAHLQKGRPLIAALKPLRGETSLHYVVIAGLDEQHNVILLNDPAQKKLLQVERRIFEKQWNAVERWTLLAVPK
jgi:ABC-type bacteriocin/lantibiotic exporter with double-glycine peptidase domain